MRFLKTKYIYLFVAYKDIIAHIIIIHVYYRINKIWKNE